MRGQQREAWCVRKARRMRTVAGDGSGDGGSEKWQRCGALRLCASDWAVQRGGSMGRTLLGICGLHHALAPVVRSKCEPFALPSLLARLNSLLCSPACLRPPAAQWGSGLSVGLSPSGGCLRPCCIEHHHPRSVTHGIASVACRRGRESLPSFGTLPYVRACVIDSACVRACTHSLVHWRICPPLHGCPMALHPLTPGPHGLN
jgi:hypothetical protein